MNKTAFVAGVFAAIPRSPVHRNLSFVLAAHQPLYNQRPEWLRHTCWAWCGLPPRAGLDSKAMPEKSCYNRRRFESDLHL
jgi:hypothetical protein